MKCINCGCELPEGARFCGNCGTPQPEHQQEEQQSGCILQYLWKGYEWGRTTGG